MFSFLQKISLRTRLSFMTAFALIALLIAVISAFRTAQMSAAFAQRQTEANVSAAVRELMRDVRDIGNQPNQFDRDGRLLPHLRDIYSRYSDDISRTTAISLRRFENVSGGFCDKNGVPQGFISANESLNEKSLAENLCREILANTDFTQKTTDAAGQNFYVVTAPVSNNKNADISGVFAFKKLPQTNGFSDRFNLLTQFFLLISVVVLVVFSFLTLREWRRGMLKIENGLHEISKDLSARIDTPKVAELEQISNEINHLAKTLQTNLQRRQELETNLARSEKLAALGRVASGVAHEVRNPLASMKLKIQLSERNKYNSEKLENTFKVLLEEIDRLDGLVKKLLDISRPTELKFAEISLVNLIEQRLLFINEKAEAANINIYTDFSDNVSMVKGDSEKLAQVFDNLLLNAIEAMPNGGNLRILINDLPECFQIKFTDDGEKINDESKEKLFEPFFTTKEKGTGLGLAISREIIEMHGGKIYLAESDQTEFVIELPKLKID